MDNTCNVSCLATLDKKNHIKDGSKRKDWIFNTNRFNRGGNGRIVPVNGYFCTTNGIRIEDKYFIIHGLIQYGEVIKHPQYHVLINQLHKNVIMHCQNYGYLKKYINHMINLLLIKRI